MKRTPILAAGVLAAALLVGAGGGTTTATWRDEVAVAGGTIVAGTLDVALARDSVDLRYAAAATTYTLVTTLTGDNIDGRLVLSVPEWAHHRLLDALTIVVRVHQDGSEPVLGELGREGVFLFDGSPDVPLALSPGTTTLSLALSATVNPGAGGTSPGVLPVASLVADLRQVRPAHDGGDALWSDRDLAPTPSFEVVGLIVGSRASVGEESDASSTAPVEREGDAGSTAPVDGESGASSTAPVDGEGDAGSTGPVAAESDPSPTAPDGDDPGDVVAPAERSQG